LTGTRDRVGPHKSRVRYSCRLGTAIPHPRISISEHLILPAVRVEADRLRTPEEVEATGDQGRQGSALEARRVRILDMYEAAHIDRAELARRLAAVTEAQKKIEAKRMILRVPHRIDWSWEPRQLNAVLRAMFDRVDLDPQSFQPVEFDWRVPEWRA
jgi:hypothetical protein